MTPTNDEPVRVGVVDGLDVVEAGTRLTVHLHRGVDYLDRRRSAGLGRRPA